MIKGALPIYITIHHIDATAYFLPVKGIQMIKAYTKDYYQLLE